MSAGKRFKFHGSQISVLVGFATDSPPQAITDITNADPPVVTSAGHGLSNGSIVKLSGIAGMIELNDEVFVVENITTDTFELADVNAVDYGEYDSGGTISVGTMSQLCELTNYNRQGGSSPEIGATSICSEAQEYEIGLPDFGTTQIDFNFAPRTTVQGALHSFYLSGEKMAVKVVLPNNGGEMIQLGFVQQESEQAGVGTLWTASATIRNTGNRVDIPAA